MASPTQHTVNIALIAAVLVVASTTVTTAVPTPTFVGDTDTVEGSGGGFASFGGFGGLPGVATGDSDADTVDQSIGRLIDHIPADTIRDLVHDHCTRDAITRRALRFAFSPEGARRRSDFMRMPEVQEQLRWLEQHGVNVNATMQRLLFVFGLDKAAEMKAEMESDCWSSAGDQLIQLVENVLQLIPRDEIIMQLLVEMEVSPALNKFLDELGQRGFFRSLYNITGTSPFQFLSEELAEHCFELETVVRLFIKRFSIGW